MLKIAVRATLPLMMVLGAVSYTLYLRGGDPLALLSSVGGGASAQVSAMFASVKSTMGTTLAAAQSTLPAAADASDGNQTLYRWTDASGSPHYSNVKPVGVGEIDVVKVDPNQNLLQAVKGTTAERTAQQAADPSLPGAAGIALPGVDPALVLGDAL